MDPTRKPDPDLSIIIPVLYEAKRIQTCLANLANLAGNINLEMIVVDGDPEESTLKHLPFQYPHMLKGIQSPQGRGTQMNAGAKIAQGTILLFLHADTDLPDRALQEILHACTQNSCAGGAFDLAIASPRWSLKLIGKVASWRSRLTRIPYGDQAIFIRKNVFEQIQGYPDIPLMEDVALMQRLKQQGYSIHILGKTVRASARRWEKEGIVRCTLRNWSLILLYSLGIAPETLARWYRPTPKRTSR
ncbi:MAG: glycosyltransferase family 2 protein [Acaryochloridaceae cyanobacterium RU_4_10]|nr:glycosyltransferase family 2 protein [Acaryochloridaceae cyanobacterium RU_4_10]